MDVKDIEKKLLPWGTMIIMPGGTEFYSEEYVKEMMRREHSRGYQEGIRIEKHIAVFEMINEDEKKHIGKEREKRKL